MRYYSNDKKNNTIRFRVLIVRTALLDNNEMQSLEAISKTVAFLGKYPEISFMRQLVKEICNEIRPRLREKNLKLKGAWSSLVKWLENVALQPY